jgi:Tfp pilus assembly protein PilF
MNKGHTFFVLGAAGAACAAIAVGVVTNHRDDLGALVEAPPMETILATSHTTASAYESEPVETSTSDEAAVEIAAAVAETRVEFEVASVQASPEVEEAVDAEAETESVETGMDMLPEARLAFMQKDYETTVGFLEPMAAAGEARFDVHYLLGLAQRYVGNAEASEIAMSQALAIQPDNVRALVNSARALLELDRVDEAETRMRHAIDIAPGDGDAWNVLGRVQLAQGSLEEAEASFVTASDVAPENAWALNNLGYTRLQREAWAEAEEALAQAIALRDDLAIFHNNMGVALERLQKLEAAALAYARAVQLQPDHVRAQVSLGRVAALVGEDVETLLAAQKTSAEPASTKVATPEEEAKSSEETLAADVGGQP